MRHFYFKNIMGKLIIKRRYGTIPNDLLNSSDISFKAKGLYAYIQSKPENWEFSAERISKQVKEGLPSVVSALKELETFGYLVRKRYQNNRGFWIVDYLLYEIPIEENLYTGNPIQENPNIGNTTNYSNKDFSKKDNNIYNNKKEDIVKEQVPTFYERVLEFENLLEGELENFYSYWNEKSLKNGKSRWESEKFFDISRRVKTWMQNQNKFKQNGNTNNEPKLGTSAARMEALRKW
jgi:hypothetical protein